MTTGNEHFPCILSKCFRNHMTRMIWCLPGLLCHQFLLAPGSPSRPSCTDTDGHGDPPAPIREHPSVHGGLKGVICLWV